MARMTIEKTNERIDSLEQKLDKVLEMLSTKPSNRVSGASAPKTVKEPKELKTYTEFSKSTKSYTAKSVDSKGGNHNALLQVKFAEIPSAKNRALLKAYGFRWNKTNASWDNANTTEAQEVFKVLK